MIVRTYTTPSGATVHIDDSYMAAPGSAEEARVIREQRRVAYEILAAASKRDTEEKAGS